MTIVLQKQSGRWMITGAQNGSAEDRSNHPLNRQPGYERNLWSSSFTNRMEANGKAVEQMLARQDRLWTSGDFRSVAGRYLAERLWLPCAEA